VALLSLGVDAHTLALTLALSQRERELKSGSPSGRGDLNSHLPLRGRWCLDSLSRCAADGALTPSPAARERAGVRVVALLSLGVDAHTLALTLALSHRERELE
jgi:hypothetical protein